MAFVCKIVEIIIILKKLQKSACLVALAVKYALVPAILNVFNAL